MSSRVYILKEKVSPYYDPGKVWSEKLFIYSSYSSATKEMIRRRELELERMTTVKEIQKIPYMERVKEDKIFESQNSNHVKKYTIIEKELLE